MTEYEIINICRRKNIIYLSIQVLVCVFWSFSGHGRQPTTVLVVWCNVNGVECCWIVIIIIGRLSCQWWNSRLRCRLCHHHRSSALSFFFFDCTNETHFFANVCRHRCYCTYSLARGTRYNFCCFCSCLFSSPLFVCCCCCFFCVLLSSSWSMMSLCVSVCVLFVLQLLVRCAAAVWMADCLHLWSFMVGWRVFYESIKLPFSFWLLLLLPPSPPLVVIVVFNNVRMFFLFCSFAHFFAIVHYFALVPRVHGRLFVLFFTSLSTYISMYVYMLVYRQCRYIKHRLLSSLLQSL